MGKFRHRIQGLFTILFNGYGRGWLTGTIYSGPLKHVCVPVLNCYSCPGALGACPVGSLQAVLGSAGRTLSFYVAGLILFFAVLAGRLLCGFLCPFGFLQDLLYKIPLKKRREPEVLKKYGVYIKYVVLAVFVIGLPMALTDEFGISPPYFCKYICPAGLVEGGIPLLIGNPSLRRVIGGLFTWKAVLAGVILFFAMVIYRPFCKYLCPLGAIYGLFNKVSSVRLSFSESACIHCNRCAEVCKMNVKPYETPDSPECIRCTDCVRVCPVNALNLTFGGKEKNSVRKVIR